MRTNSAPAAWQRSRALVGRGEQLVVAGVLVAQLDDVGAAGQRPVEGMGQPVAVGDEVQARVAQAGASVHYHRAYGSLQHRG